MPGPQQNSPTQQSFRIRYVEDKQGCRVSFPCRPCTAAVTGSWAPINSRTVPAGFSCNSLTCRASVTFCCGLVWNVISDSRKLYGTAQGCPRSTMQLLQQSANPRKAPHLHQHPCLAATDSIKVRPQQKQHDAGSKSTQQPQAAHLSLPTLTHI